MGTQQQAGQRRYYVLNATRLTPLTAISPDGRRLGCKGQRATMDGHFDLEALKEVAQDWIQDHFGGGKILCNVHNPDNDNKICRRWEFNFDGLPNFETILADMYGGAMPGGSVSEIATPTGMIPQIPLDPAEKIKREAKVIEAEDELEQAKQRREERRIEALKRRAQLNREREKVEDEEEAREEQRRYGMVRPPMHFGPAGFGAGEPVNELDRPVSVRDLMAQQQVQALQGEISELKHMMKEQPKGDTKDMVVSLTSALAPVLLQMMTNNQKMAEIQRASQDSLIKTMLDNASRADQTMTTIIKAIGLTDDRNKNSMDQIVNLIRLGSEMSAGESGGIVSDICQGVGDIAKGVAETIVQARQPMAQVRPAGPPQPALRAPMPLPGQVSAQLPQPRPVPQSMPQPVQRVLAPQSVQQAPEEGVQPVSAEEEMGEVVTEVLRAILAQCESQPNEPDWTEVAYYRLPNKYLRLVANTPDEDALIRMFKPFAPVNLGAQLLVKMQANPSIKSWLRRGLADLRGSARQQIEEDDKNGPSPAEGGAAGEPSDSDIEPVEEEGLPERQK